MEIVLTWRELAVAVLLASLVYLLEFALFSRRRKRADKDDSQSLRKLRADIAALQHRMTDLEVKLGMAEPREADTVHAAYDYAVQYARQGMIAPEIAARCGISRDEAALIVAMHSQGQET